MVSFDYDNTLDHREVQRYALGLLKRGFEVYICTYRGRSFDNTFLYYTMGRIGIKRENVIFTNLTPKSPFIKDMIFHLDDMPKDGEVDNWVVFKEGWKEKCEELIRNSGIKR